MSGPRVVALTGAGISVESGIPPFTGPDGLWEGHRPQDVASGAAFAADPATVHRFHNTLRRRLRNPAVAPNAAHRALARLEYSAGDDFHLITQNIDDLHTRAGTTRITSMHGELTKIRHVRTGEVRACHDDVDETDTQWRPHVVWFGEPTIGLQSVVDMIAGAEVFIVIGTSCRVQPASQFPLLAKACGATTVEINPEPSGLPFDHVLAGPASTCVPDLVDQLITGMSAAGAAPTAGPQS